MKVLTSWQRQDAMLNDPLGELYQQKGNADGVNCSLSKRSRLRSPTHHRNLVYPQWHTLCLLSGGMERSGWVKNAWRQPTVTDKTTDIVFTGRARRVNDLEEDALMRHLIGEKYRESEVHCQWICSCERSLPSTSMETRTYSNGKAKSLRWKVTKHNNTFPSE